jgi:predicted lipoprotein with Yx(FWY)xxD motif
MGRLRFAAGALPLILILAACSSAASPSPVAPSAAPSVAASQPPAASQAAAGGGYGANPSSPAASPSAETADAYALKVNAGSGAVTNYLSGEDGKTLYQFKNDTVNSGKSTCYAGCDGTWPPFTVDSLDEVKPDAAVTGKLALITRDDGKKQVTYKGWPLYYFSGDTKAGDTNGQGFLGKWFVVNP